MSDSNKALGLETRDVEHQRTDNGVAGTSTAVDESEMQRMGKAQEFKVCSVANVRRQIWSLSYVHRSEVFGR